MSYVEIDRLASQQAPQLRRPHSSYSVTDLSCCFSQGYYFTLKEGVLMAGGLTGLPIFIDVVGDPFFPDDMA